MEFTKKVLNGLLCIYSDSSDVMKKRIDTIFKEGLVVKHSPIEKWIFIDSEKIWAKIPTLTDDNDCDVMFFGFSPIMTVGVSFETKHFTRAFGYFPKIPFLLLG